jgi:hypothetical protein
MNDHPPECHYCKVRPVQSQIAWPTTLRHICDVFWKTSPIRSRTPSSTANELSTGISLNNEPAGSAPTSSSSSLPYRPPLPPPPSQSNAPNNAANPQGWNSVTSQDEWRYPLWVVFGISTLGAYHNIENLEITKQTNDRSFFPDLKMKHKTHHWWFQNWFSLFRFRSLYFVEASTYPGSNVAKLTSSVRWNYPGQSNLCWGGTCR